MKIGFWLIVIGLATAAAWFVFGRLEGSAPVVAAPDEILLGQAPVQIEIDLQDADSGLRSVSARLLHEAGSRSLLQKTYAGDLIRGGPSGRQKMSLALDLGGASGVAPDGDATLVLQIRDWSWRSGLTGNRREVSIPVVIDTRAPELRVESGVTYIHRGGAAAAVYQLAEPTQEDGVQAGESFFPGYPHPSGEPNRRIAIFAIPVEAPANPRVEVVARDRAGNQGTAAFPAKVLERVFRKSQIEIQEDFVRKVAEPLARQNGLLEEDLAATFRGVNEKLRARNEITIREKLAASEQPRPLWKGAFRQLPSSQVTSRFAEDRSYVMGGETISRARHYGFDLASVARAPVTAAADGVVVHAGNLGIYGGCVILDHGLGVASLYGHLSDIGVDVGESVTVGQTVGRSGLTGLAGGDHLHFAILVGNEYVDPLEWWDAKWLRSHISVRLEPSTR